MPSHPPDLASDYGLSVTALVPHRGGFESDCWVADEAWFVKVWPVEGPYGASFLAEYGTRDLDLDHLEYALLARALRDMAARVLAETDRPGVDTWGFRRIAKLDHDLALFRPFCT